MGCEAGYEIDDEPPLLDREDDDSAPPLYEPLDESDDEEGDE